LVITFYTLAEGIIISPRRLQRKRSHKVYKFMISITRRVDLVMPVFPSDRLSVWALWSWKLYELESWDFRLRFL